MLLCPPAGDLQTCPGSGSKQFTAFFFPDPGWARAESGPVSNPASLWLTNKGGSLSESHDLVPTKLSTNVLQKTLSGLLNCY